MHNNLKLSDAVYQKSHQGFTLVELVAVIAIAGIVAATALPKFVSSNSFSTRADTGALASALRYAQKTAIAQHRTVFFLLTTATRNIRLCYDSACATAVIDPVTQSAFNQTLSNAVTLSAGGLTTLGFDALGRPTNSTGTLLATNTTFTIQNTTQATQSTLISVEAETGYVR